MFINTHLLIKSHLKYYCCNYFSNIIVQQSIFDHNNIIPGRANFLIVFIFNMDMKQPSASIKSSNYDICI